MLISYSHNFLFIHIYKTAGTSITSSLIPYSRFTDRIAYQYWPTRKMINVLNWVFADKFNQFVTGFHKHALLIEAQKKMGKQIFDSLFKFAFVRNPWDWRVSLYFYIKGAKKHRFYVKLQQMDFVDFVEWDIQQTPLRQIDFLKDRNKQMIVDFVGKYENLDDDFNYVQNKLSLEVEPLKKSNISGLREYQDYRKYYDAKTAEKIYTYFKEDIDTFGYEFD